jgi:translation initiation factor IF-3
LAPKTRINHQISAPSVRVITETGENLGVLTLSEALRAAESRGLDLIEISPNAAPPVAKIMDFGKYQYAENKKQKGVKVHTTETKSIQVKIGTGDHDLEIKANKVSQFLREGHRVKVELFLPGRSKYFDQKFLAERLERLLKFVSEAYKIADPPKKSPKGLTAVIERDK